MHELYKDRKAITNLAHAELKYEDERLSSLAMLNVYTVGIISSMNISGGPKKWHNFLISYRYQ